MPLVLSIFSWKGSSLRSAAGWAEGVVGLASVCWMGSATETMVVVAWNMPGVASGIIRWPKLSTAAMGMKAPSLLNMLVKSIDSAYLETLRWWAVQDVKL